jgi:hypothetical protein
MLPHAEKSIDQAGLRDLQSGMSILRDDPRYFEVDGRDPEKEVA